MKSDSYSLKIANLQIANEIETKSNERQQDSSEVADFETAVSLTGYGKFNYLLLLAVLPGIFSTVFDTSVISFVLPSAECELNLSNFDKGILNGSIYGGMISSAFLWGFLSDSLGRKKLLIIGYLLDGICDIGVSISPNFWLIFVFKFLGGCIISGPFAVMISYLAEFHSAKYRARVIMIAGVYISMANTLMPVLAWVFIPQTWYVSYWNGSFTYNAWRCFVTVAALPSLLGALLMLFFDESPKFLMTAGRNEEALRVFRRVYHMNTGKHPDTYPVKMLIDSTSIKTPDPLAITATNKSPINILRVFWKQTKPLLSPPHVSNAVLIFTNQFLGLLVVNTIRLWLPQLFAKMQDFSHAQSTNPNSTGASLCTILTEYHSNGTNIGGDMDYNQTNIYEPCSLGAVDGQTYLNSVIVGATSTMCYFAVSFFINFFGKKKLMTFGFFMAGICGLSIFFAKSPQVLLALFAVFMALSGVSCNIILSIVVDVFPTNIRAMAVSLTMMCGRTGSLIGNLMFPMLLDFRCELPFFLLGGMTIGASALSYFLPVSQGKALE